MSVSRIINSIKSERTLSVLYTLLLTLFAGSASAAIDISVDIEAQEEVIEKASTYAKKVFVERVELSFPNGRASQTIPVNQKGFYALANFKYLGNGPLTIRWKVDGAVISQSTEHFRFGQSVEVRSDKNKVSLPSFKRGAHNVALEMENRDGLVAVSADAIEYFVADGATAFRDNEKVELIYPNQQTLVQDELAFRWKGTASNSSFFLEVEREASKYSPAKSVIKALSKIDAYKPSPTVLKSLEAGLYRWRVSGRSGRSSLEPTEWNSFELIDAGDGQKQVVISKVSTSVTSNKELAVFGSASRPTSQQILRGQENGFVASVKRNTVSGKVVAGQTYQIKLDILNADRNLHSGALIEITDGAELLGRFPVELPVGHLTQVSIPLKAKQTEQTEYSSYSITLIDDNYTLDSANLNLTVSPEMRLDGLDFEELNVSRNLSSEISLPCGDAPPHGLAYSRIVSARQGDTNQSIQSLLNRGYFQFDAGETVRVSAYYEDHGLWSRVKETTKGCTRGEGLSNFELSFLAHPVDLNGQLIGSPISLGKVSIGKTTDKLILESPEWTISSSGQYLITLNDISEPADLYATLPGSLPPYVKAGGFVLELGELQASSTLISESPRLALINGVATTSWLGDQNQQQMPMTLTNAQVSIGANPLVGELSAGEASLAGEPDSVMLDIVDADVSLNALTINKVGALADLSYQMPGTYAESLLTPLSVNASSARKNMPITAIDRASQTGKVLFENVNVFNGGEFVARYDFGNQWDDIRIDEDRVALRVRGASLVLDASPHLSYTDYINDAQGESFTGLGFHDALVRLQVLNSSGLFKVQQAESSFIYGRSNWLGLSDGKLNGEQIQLLAPSRVSNFFGQEALDSLSLDSPNGFELQLDGGVFGLRDSKLGGLDASGFVSVPANEEGAVQADRPLRFSHLTRRQSATGQNLFQTEAIADSGVSFDLGVFSYQPAYARLLVGEEETQGYHEAQSPNLNAIEEYGYEAISNWQEQLERALRERAGLALLGGEFTSGWSPLGESDQDSHDGMQRAGFSGGAFRIDSHGLTGQWLAARDLREYRTAGFNAEVPSRWLSFQDSALVDSFIEGEVIVPYPVDQRFAFKGQLNQEAGFEIGASELSLPQGESWDLAFWRARLYNPQTNADSAVSGSAEPSLINESRFASRLNALRGNGSEQSILFDGENQLIRLQNFPMSLPVDEAYGGDEFVSLSGEAPFTITTDISPKGELLDTTVTAHTDLQFVGQAFELNSRNAVIFEPYLGSGQRPSSDEVPSSLSLVSVDGDVNFETFGPYQVSVKHTALGAKVPYIERAVGVDEHWGEGAIRVKSDLKFVNTFGRNQNGMNEQLAAVDQASTNAESFKSFVGEAELVLINAVSVKGLAEAGIHVQQSLDDQGNWISEGGEKVGYEKVGVGAGADILKATLAGVRGMETATRLGGAGIEGLTGVEGMGEQAVELGVETISLVKSVATATAVAAASGGAAASEEIRHAVANGFATTQSGIELLETICEKDEDCTEATELQLDIAALLARTAEGVTEFEQLEPKEVAGISLQALDTGIPLVRGLNASGPSNEFSIDDPLDAGLSAGHTIVGAARSILDNDGKMPFEDFIDVSRRAVRTAEDTINISGIVPEEEKGLAELAVAIANESIDMAEGLRDDDSANKLASMIGQSVALLCRHNQKVNALFGKAGLSDSHTDLVQPMISLSAQVMNELSEKGLPSNAQQATSTFLVTLLDSLSQGFESVEGCQAGEGIDSPVLQTVQSLFTIAAHAIRPLSGIYQNEAELFAWGLEGVALNVQATQTLAQQLTGQSFPQAEDLVGVLDKLQQSFSELENELSEDGNAANGQRFLRIARAIPAAFEDLIDANVSGDNDAELVSNDVDTDSEAPAVDETLASSVLDIYITLLRELDPFIAQAPAIAQEDFSNVDLFALPLALIDEIDDLFLLNTCQKLGLANINHMIGLVKVAGGEKPELVPMLAKAKAIHGNIKTCGKSGIASSPVVEQTMSVLDLAASTYDGKPDVQKLVINKLEQMLPLFVANTSRMLESVRALTTALPIIDFSQDELTVVLDVTLIKLLNEAYDNAPTNEVKQAISEARSIISHADFDVIGFHLEQDAQGNVTYAKDVLPDGSIREISGAMLVQFYPEGHPEYAGGLKEVLSYGEINISNFESADFESLFTENWDAIFAASEVMLRSYKDADSNHIEIEDLGGLVLAGIRFAVSIGINEHKDVVQLDSMPVDLVNYDTLLDDHLSHYLVTKFRVLGEHADCPFAEGCTAMYTQGIPMFKLVSNTDPRHYALFDINDSYNFSSHYEILESIDEMRAYSGRIISSENGWNPTWEVRHQGYGSDLIKVIDGYSSDLIQIAEDWAGYSNLDELRREIQAGELKHRRVVNGNDIWDYNTLSVRATHSASNGEWAIYHLPEFLPDGIAIPSPKELLPESLLDLSLRGNAQGVLEDPYNVAGNYQSDEGLEIPASAEGEVVRINFVTEAAVNSESSAGSAVSIGGVSTEVIANTDPAQSSNQGSDAAETEVIAEDVQRVTQSDGSTHTLSGSQEDNLSIVRVEDADGSRTTTIKFCQDPTKSLRDCANQDSFESETSYHPGFSHSVFYMPPRVPITPASGVNQAQKHQLWLDIFEQERQLKLEPTLGKLNQLARLVDLGKELGIDATELNNQHKAIAGPAIEKLVVSEFERFDQEYTSPTETQRWIDNPQSSPGYKIGDLIEQGMNLGLGVNIHAQDFSGRMTELLILNSRSYVFSLRDLRGTNPDVMLERSKPYVEGLAKLAFQSQAYQNNLLATEFTESICSEMNHLVDNIEAVMLGENSQYIILDSDVRLATNLTANMQAVGCEEGYEITLPTQLAEKLEGGNRDEGQLYDGGASTLPRVQFVALFDKLANHDANTNFNQLIEDHMGLTLGNLQTTEPRLFDKTIEKLIDFERVIQAVEAEQIHRRANNQSVFIYPSAPQDAQEQLATKLKEGWEHEYQRLFDEFNNSETRNRDMFEALATHYEKGQAINTQLRSILDRDLIELDTNTYMRAKVNGAWRNPLQRIADVQNEWIEGIDGIWRRGRTDAEFDELKTKLHEQDDLIIYVKSILPDSMGSGLRTLDERIQEEVTEDLDIVDTNLARPGSLEDIAEILRPIPEILNILHKLGPLPKSEALVDQRMDDFYADRVQRVKDNYGDLGDEIKKIIALKQVDRRSGNEMPGENLGTDDNIIEAVRQAEVNIIYQLETGGDEDDVKDLISLIALKESLGIATDEDSLADAAQQYLTPLFNERFEQFKRRNFTSLENIVGQGRDLSARLAAITAAGAAEDTPFAEVQRAIVEKLQAWLDQSGKACIQSRNCTKQNIDAAKRASVAIAGMGGEIDTPLIKDMIDSSPVTFNKQPGVEQVDSRPTSIADLLAWLPNTSAIAASVQQIGEHVSLASAASREYLRGMVIGLQHAAESLARTRNTDIQLNEPFFNAADVLQGVLDGWLSEASGDIAGILAENPGAIVDEESELLSGFSEAELEGIILPALNGQPDEQRIIPGNKYRLAAEALEASGELGDEAFLNLSYRIMKYIPDPEITAEGDYRLAGVRELVAFGFIQNGDLALDIAGQVDTDLLYQVPAAAALAGIMSIPASDQPVQKIADLLRDNLIPQITGGELRCTSGVGECVLSTGMQMIATGLDSALGTAQSGEAQQNAQTANYQEVLISYLKTFASKLSDLQGGSEALWLGLGGEALELSLSVLEQGSNLQTVIVSKGLNMANRVIASPTVSTQIARMPEPIPMAYGFVRESNSFLIEELSSTNDQNLPIVFARMAHNGVVGAVSNVNSELGALTDTLGAWQLDFSDKNWSLVTSTITGNVDGSAWLAAMNGPDGVASLNCRINQLANIEIPPALPLTPFVTAQSLAERSALLGQSKHAPKLLANLGADLSNLWFEPPTSEGEGCAGIVMRDGSEDHALAKLIRSQEDIDLDAKPSVKGLQAVGNLGLGAFEALVPGTKLSVMMDLAWNGSPNTSPTGVGINELLALSLQGQSADISAVIEKVERVPATVSEIVERLTSPQDSAAKALRYLTGNTQQADLTAPDQLLGTDKAYAIPNSLLAVLGEVRKAWTPSRVNDFENDPQWGYLKTVPFITMDNGAPQVSGGTDFGIQLQQMADAVGEGAAKSAVAGADLARLGVTAIGPLINPDLSNQRGVASVQERALFNDLAGAGAGFSGLSGGYQREWLLNGERDENDNSFLMELYGELVFPMLGRQVGVLQFNQTNNTQLDFIGAQATEGVGDLVGGITGDIVARFETDERGDLNLAFQGDGGLNVLSNTIADIGLSGRITGFERASQSSDPGAYALALAEHVDVSVCGLLEGQVLPFPLSLTGLAGTANLGAFGEKNGTTMSFGSRVGLGAELSTPLINSLLGVRLDGYLTSAFVGDLNVRDGSVAGAVQACASPGLEVKILGQRMDLNTLDVELAGFTEGDIGGSGAVGIKMQIGLNSDVWAEVQTQVCSDVAWAAVCAAAQVMSEGSIWLVQRNALSNIGRSNTSSLSNEIYVGFGELPDEGEPATYLKGTYDGPGSPPANPGIVIEQPVGAWGGWPNEGSQLDLCSKQLCAMSEFEHLSIGRSSGSSASLSTKESQGARR